MLSRRILLDWMWYPRKIVASSYASVSSSYAK
jgi:hypothetical protein